MSRSYAEVRRGFRIRSPTRFSVQVLRGRFVFLFKVVNKWKLLYCRALRFLKRGMMMHAGRGRRRLRKVCQMGSTRSMMNNGLVADFSHECRMRSFGRSNSFYSEAIADCLEFIKRSSTSDKEDEDEKPVNPGSHHNLSSLVS